jgi:dodecin
MTMSIAKVIEISSRSPEGFDDAVRRGLERASKTVNNISGAWIKEQKVDVDEESGKITAFRVDMKVTFIMNT